MFYNDHAPPHFHAKYAEHEASIRINSLGILEGYLPPKALSLVMGRAALHQQEYDDYKLWLLFDDGVSGEVDLKKLVGKGVFLLGNL